MNKIISKPNSAEYDENYDKIFKHKEHCNLLHPATLGTKEDFCDCKKDNYPKYGYWYNSDTGEYYYHDERGDKFVSTDEEEWKKV